MTAANLNLYIRADITLKLRDTPATTKTIYLTNRPILTGNFDTVNFVPIIQEIGGVGSVMGDYIPIPQAAQLRVSNAPHSFGYQRRLVDLFERYEPIGASCTIKAAVLSADADATSATSFGTTIFSSEIVGWSTSGEGEAASLTLSLAEQALPRREIAKMITAEEFPDAPNGSLGKYLPLSFGTQIDCPATLIKEGDAPEYAYATTLGDVWITRGASVFVRDYTGDYQWITSPPSVTTPVASVTGPGFANWVWSPDYTEIAIELDSGPIVALSCVLTQGRVAFAATGNAGWLGGNGALIFTLYEGSTTDNTQLTPIAYAKRDMSAYETEFRGLAVATVWVEFAWDRAVVLRFPPGSGGPKRYLGIKAQQGTATSIPDLQFNAVTSNYWLRPKTGGDGWVQGSISSTQLIYDLYAAVFTENLATSAEVNAQKLGHTRITVTQKTAISGVSNPRLDELDIVVRHNGVRDQVPPQITGTPIGAFDRLHWALKALTTTTNASTWDTIGTIDQSRHSTAITNAFQSNPSSFPFRGIGGRTDGQTRVDQLIESLCRSSAARIGKLSDGTLFLWAWGSEQATVATITDEDATIEVQSLGTETVINRAAIQYDRRIIDADIVRALYDRTLSNYSQAIVWDESTNAITSEISADSTALHGIRNLAQPAHDWLGADVQSPQTMARYYLSYYRRPHWYATVTVPWHKFSFIELLDVVEIVHPSLPTFFGSAGAAKPTSYDGTVTEPLGGRYLKRANRYHAIVEGKRFIQGVDLPVLQLRVRLLTDYPFDPT